MRCRSLVAAVAAVAAAALVPVAQASPNDTFRVAGADRYQTSLAVSRDGWQPDPAKPTAPIVDYVVVASGVSFADGLAAGSGSGATWYASPLLLVPATGTLPVGFAEEVRRLGAKGIVIAGGTGAVSTGIETQLKALVGTANVQRAAGATRYGTAAALAEGMDKGGTVYLATGTDFADGLTASATAGAKQEPLLLTKPTVLPTETRDALKALAPKQVVIVGGTGAVSLPVASAVKAAVPNATITRLSGATRYDTAVALSRRQYVSAETVWLASGERFPDALSAGPEAAYYGSPLLLARSTCIPKATLAEIARLGAKQVVLIGGKGVLSDAVISRVPCAR